MRNCGAAAICTFLSGRYLARREKRMFSFVMAAILCIFFPPCARRRSPLSGIRRSLVPERIVSIWVTVT